jgi:hypothetical protein
MKSRNKSKEKCQSIRDNIVDAAKIIDGKGLVCRRFLGR